MKVAIIDPSCFTMSYDHCLCEALVRQGCKVSFISSYYKYSKWKNKSSYHQIVFFYNRTNRLIKHKSPVIFKRIAKGFEHLLDMFRLTKFLKQLKPSVIHFQWLPLPIIDRLFIPSLQAIAPIILTAHDLSPYQNTPLSAIQRFYFTSTLNLFDHLIIHTKSSFKVIAEKLNIPKTKVSIIPMGTFDYYKNMIASQPKSTAVNGKRVILFFGAIKPYKRLDVLIEAFAKLPKNLLNETILLVAGNPKMDIAPLKTLANNLGVSKHIQWQLEYIPEEEVGDVLEKATIFVLSHKHIEAQSAVLMTMLPFGKPIVATKTSGFSEVLTNGVHGYLVEPDNPFELARALESILTDPLKIKNMGKAVQQLANEAFSWDSIAQKTIEMYQRLLKQQNSNQ